MVLRRFLYPPRCSEDICVLGSGSGEHSPSHGQLAAFQRERDPKGPPTHGHVISGRNVTRDGSQCDPGRTCSDRQQGGLHGEGAWALK